MKQPHYFDIHRAVIGWRHVDNLYELPDLFGRRIAGDDRVAQSFDQRRNAVAVPLRDSRLEHDDRHRLLLRHIGAEPVARGHTLRQRGPQVRESCAPVRDRGDEARYSGFLLLQLRTEGALRLLGGLRLCGARIVIFAHKKRYRLGREQLFLQPRKHAALQLRAVDPATVIACSGLAVPRAAEARVCDHGDASLAHATLEQARQEVLRPPALDERESSACRPRVLGCLPEFVADDPQLGHLGEDDLIGGVRPDHPIPGFRIALHVDAIVSEPADVDRVMENAEHPGLVPEDR